MSAAAGPGQLPAALSGIVARTGPQPALQAGLYAAPVPRLCALYHSKPAAVPHRWAGARRAGDNCRSPARPLVQAGRARRARADSSPARVRNMLYSRVLPNHSKQRSWRHYFIVAAQLLRDLLEISRCHRPRHNVDIQEKRALLHAGCRAGNHADRLRGAAGKTEVAVNGHAIDQLPFWMLRT